MLRGITAQPALDRETSSLNGDDNINGFAVRPYDNWTRRAERTSHDATHSSSRPICSAPESRIRPSASRK